MKNVHEEVQDIAGAHLRLRFPPDARYGKFVRERLTSFAETYALPIPDLREFISAVGEALANAVEHAKTRDAIEISAWFVHGSLLMATVVDTGIGFTMPQISASPALPPPDSERGRGLPIMRSCTDLFTVRSKPGQGTAVILGRYLRDGHRPDRLVSAG
jgi:anti-sigma regulatory factor (Ser/Thr protein kinase)